jgi:hypothetical protein
VNNGERPEEKKGRLGFFLILAVWIGVVGYLNHGRLRPDFGPNAVLRDGCLLLGIAVIVCIYIWWANRRDFK